MILTFTEDLSVCQGALRVGADVPEDVWHCAWSWGTGSRSSSEGWGSSCCFAMCPDTFAQHQSAHSHWVALGLFTALPHSAPSLEFFHLNKAWRTQCGPIVYDLNKREFPSTVFKFVPSQGVHFSTVFELILSFFNFEGSLSAMRKASMPWIVKIQMSWMITQSFIFFCKCLLHGLVYSVIGLINYCYTKWNLCFYTVLYMYTISI